MKAQRFLVTVKTEKETKTFGVNAKKHHQSIIRVNQYIKDNNILTGIIETTSEPASSRKSANYEILDDNTLLDNYQEEAFD